MNESSALNILILLIIGALLLIAGCTIDNWGDDVSEYYDVTDKAGASAPVYIRKLRCLEDEDIVVTLGNNGLPEALCLQAIER